MALPSNVRFALRSLRRRPAFAATAILMLALGIGANTAMFSVVDAVLLRSLPYGDPDSLVVLFADGSARGQSRYMATTPGDFLDWREYSHVFSGLTVLHNESRRITSVETPVVPLVHAVTANYFDVLGVKPLLGRSFRAGEDESGRDDVAMLSYGLWQSVFGGDPGIVGRSIALDGRQHTVVGVIGPEFYSAHIFSVQPGLWVPMPLADLQQERSTRDLLAYGRLAPGRSLPVAQAAMTTLSARIASEHPDTNDGWGVKLVPLREHVVGRFSRTGAILLAAVGLVLLIACANAANLSLARATERAQEVAMRTALGASRRHIFVQLLTESLILSLAAGGIGALLARMGAGPLAHLIPSQAGVPFLDRVAVDGRVLAFTLVISVVSGVLFGLVPSRHATRMDLVQVLREGGRGTAPAHVRRLRELLVVGEVALAVVVVSAAGLVLQTFAGLRSIDPGFDAPHILKLRTALRGDHFQSPAARIAHFDELKRRLAALPGVASVSAISFEPPPVGDGGAVFGAVRIAFPDKPETSGAAPSAIARPIMPDYFETMRIPILRGRGVTGDDMPDSRRVAVVSESMARRYFAGEDPLGRTFSLYGPRQTPMEIVGVVGDVMTAGTDPTPAPAFYVPYTQSPLPVMSVVMRVPKADPAAPAHEAERIAWSLSPDTNVYSVETLDRQIDQLNWQTRFGATLLGGFALLALLLGMAGIYAVVSYTVLQRRTEIALRMALGARARDVLGMILAGGLRLVLFGLLAGLVASLAATRALSGFLYGVRPGDPVTLAGVAGLLLLVAAAACLGPALRASHVDPQATLRLNA
jgi:putative ABC transport system permease protein